VNAIVGRDNEDCKACNPRCAHQNYREALSVATEALISWPNAASPRIISTARIAKVRCGALACPECGSDDETGWSEDWDGDLPTGYGNEKEFDYDEFMAQEFPEHAKRTGHFPKMRWIWRIAALLILIATLLVIFGR
jgi:hypothetical protein